MTVALGYLLPTRERVMVGEHRTDAILELAEHAEASGLDSVWVGDSLLAKPRHDPLTLLAALAARTRRITLGTAVLLPMLRNPVVLAQQVATLDQIATGRLVVGLGIARDVPAIRAEFEAAGVPFERRVGRMLDGVRLMRSLWQGHPVDYDGLWRVREAELGPLPYRVGGPPLWGGGAAPGALRRCGRYFDGWFPSGPGGPPEWADGWRQVMSSASEQGRGASRVTPAAYVTVSMSEDVATANAELDAYVEAYYAQPAALVRANQFTFAGTPDDALAWLAAFVRSGVRHLCVRFAGRDDAACVSWLSSLRGPLTKVAEQ
ncbi:MAG: LLM class flavin-dependent oxidoreductase [Pseudomonadota bacterium]